METSYISVSKLTGYVVYRLQGKRQNGEIIYINLKTVSCSYY